jgi:putative oxidoreductase
MSAESNVQSAASAERRSMMIRLLKGYSFISHLADEVASHLSWVGPLLARLTVGLVFFQSGWGKLNNLEQVIEFFTSLGLPAPAFQAVLASSAELVCGGLLLAGLATRLAVVPLVITMIVAIGTALWDQVDGLGSLVGLLEFAYIALLVFIGTNGPGPISLDWLIGRLVARNDSVLATTTHHAAACS